MEVKIPKEIDEVKWEEYFITGTNVLKNKIDITSQEEITKKE